MTEWMSLPPAGRPEGQLRKILFLILHLLLPQAGLRDSFLESGQDVALLRRLETLWLSKLRLQEDTEPLQEDTEPLQEDMEPLKEDMGPLQEDIKPLQEDMEPLPADKLPGNDFHYLGSRAWLPYMSPGQKNAYAHMCSQACMCDRMCSKTCMCAHMCACMCSKTFMCAHMCSQTCMGARMCT